MAIRDGETFQPSWGDLALVIAELEHANRCKIVVEMGLSSFGKQALAWDIVAKRVKGRNDWYTVAYETRRWPSHGYKSVPAMLITAAYAVAELVEEHDALPLLRSTMPEEECPPPPQGR